MINVNNFEFYIILTDSDEFLFKRISQEDGIVFDSTKSIIKAYKTANLETAIDICNKIDIAKKVCRVGLHNGDIYEKQERQ